MSLLADWEDVAAVETAMPAFDTLFTEDVIGFLSQRAAGGQRIALITLVGIDGSSPRPLGAQMGVAADGASAGYLSGGCLERAIVLEAIDAIDAGANRLVRYGKGSRYVDIVLPCGSAIELYIDVGIERATLDQLQRAADERRITGTFTDLTENGSARIASDDGPTRREGGSFWRRYVPPVQLVLSGTGPNALFLARLAQGAGLRTRFLSPDEQTLELARPFVESVTHLKTPASTPKLVADARTAVATVFHDHDWEPRILADALDSDAFYIGAMGSARTHAARLRTLAGMGYSKEALDRIRGPAGLARHARAAPELAASILAQIFDEARAMERPA